jgi:hypothetical protein
LVGIVIRLIELLIVVVPLVGVMLAAVKAVSAARGRRDDTANDTTAAVPDQSAARDQSAQWRTIARTVTEQDRTDTRWLDYELDIAKLLDFPAMTDLREPLTVRFHRAKVRADLLRPAKAEDLLDDREAARAYLDAVQEYVTAFDVAEAEAIRKRRNDFSSADQQRLTRAQNLLRVASDNGAAPQEREVAYARARKELDGLVVLPERARAAIERGIAGELNG